MRKQNSENLRRGHKSSPAGSFYADDPEKNPDENPEEEEIQEGGVEMGFASSDVLPDGMTENAAAGEESQEGGENQEEAFVYPWNDLPVREAVRKMKGADELIGLCDELARMAPVIRERGITDILQSRAYLFSINAGCGVSTAVAMLSRVYTEQKLAEIQKMPLEIFVPGDLEGGKITDEMMKVLSQIEGHLICFDISEWMNRGRDPEFLDFLIRLYDLRDCHVYIFRVPYMEQSVITGIEDALRDVFSIRTVVFSPLLASHLDELALERLSDRGYSVDEDAAHLFEVRIAEEKSDGRFYGISTVERIVDDMIFCKLRTGSSGNVITRKDLNGFVLHEDADPDIPAADELLKMAGMQQVGGELESVTKEILADRERGGEYPPHNLFFVGRPGTGKTMVARIYGRILHEKGLLERGYLLEHRAGELIGDYVGSTGPQTIQVCSDARGSVLYLDNLSDLMPGDEDDNDDGAVREAIDTLIAAMDQERGRFLVIFAGTQEEIDSLIKDNPELVPRVPYTVRFSEYTREELAAIFMHMVAHNHLRAGEGLKEAVNTYFRDLPDSVYASEEFTYARYVRNLFEKTVSKEIARSRVSQSDEGQILAGDFNLACCDSMRELNRKQSEHRIIGFRA